MAMATRSRSLLFAFSAAARRRVSPRPFVAGVADLPVLPAAAGGGGGRSFSSRPATSSLNDPSPNWSNRPPKETILLDGCDFEHWLIVMEKPEGEPTRDEIIAGYIKTLAQVVGSEEEARMKLYSVSTRHYYAFGALISEELSYKMKEVPKVRWVLPDSYLHVPTKDYGGEPVINGEPVPYDPKYHEEWVRNNARANDRSRRNDRPRNHDRTRNFERRRENMNNRDFQNNAPQQPPFNAQNAGPASPPQAPMANAQATPMGGPGGGPSMNQSVHPPNSSMPNSGFQNQPGVMNGPNYQRGPGGPNLNQSVPSGSSSMPGSGFPNQSGGMNGPNYQAPPNAGYPNQNGGNQHQGGGGFQNHGMPHGPPQNQTGGGYPNQGPGYQHQHGPGNGYQNQYGPGNGYQNQGMGNGPNGGYQNQGMGNGPNGGYQNQGMGNVPNGGYQNNRRNFPNQGNFQDMGPNQNQNMPGRDPPTMPTRDF